MAISLRASFDVVPFGRHGGWRIGEDGRPYLWWNARVSDRSGVKLSDGKSASECETQVGIYVGDATPLGQVLYKGVNPPTPIFGHAQRLKDGRIWIQLWLPAATVDQLMRILQVALPPTIAVGFGPKGLATGLAGAITRGKNHEGFIWDDAKENSAIIVEAVEIWDMYPVLAEDKSYDPHKPPIFLRYLSNGWSIAVNLVTVIAAGIILHVATTRFEVAAVSLLLLIYVAVWNARVSLHLGMRRTAAMHTEQFLAVRAQLGIPATTQESRHLSHIIGQTTEVDVAFVIDAVGAAVIGLLALYKLAPLVLS
jgi:hypothetical protein